MIRRFETRDLAEINRWYAARGSAALSQRHLPEIGFIENGVAAGFLYRMDAPAMAMLEGYISQPGAGVRRVSRAISEITTALLREAQLRGVSQVVAICAARGIERRAQEFGMRTIGVFAMATKTLEAS